jgi:hypothetical protein
MGRYYSTETGRDGKFGFGSQPSTDPGDFFEMEEQEPNEITYMLDKDNYDMVKEKVDGLYDKLKVPAEERIYYLKKEREKEDKLGDLLEKYAYKKVNNAEVKRYNKIDGFEHKTYYNEEKNKTFIDVFEGAGLCCSRVRLGLVILSDLQDDGFCELRAEL